MTDLDDKAGAGGVSVFDGPGGESYSERRRLLRLLLAGELSIGPERTEKAMRDGFELIEIWLQSRSHLKRARGLRALQAWRLASARIADAAARSDLADIQARALDRTAGAAELGALAGSGGLGGLLELAERLRLEQQAALSATDKPDWEGRELPDATGLTDWERKAGGA